MHKKTKKTHYLGLQEWHRDQHHQNGLFLSDLKYAWIQKGCWRLSVSWFSHSLSWWRSGKQPCISWPNLRRSRWGYLTTQDEQTNIHPGLEEVPKQELQRILLKYFLIDRLHESPVKDIYFIICYIKWYEI